MLSYKSMQKKIGCAILTNQKGQMSIFVALIFQVLFIFFAMAINVALVVHDKINLQNSVDLAAYYAAQRQAEFLNAMAHQNYQIRQAWKLLTWRYRVLGSVGIERPPPGRGPTEVFAHPSRFPGNAINLDERMYEPTIDTTTGRRLDYAGVCVSHPMWTEVDRNENLCNSVGLEIPPLPTVSVVAGHSGYNFFLSALADNLRERFDAACSLHGAYNWWFSMSILQGFRADQKNRRLLIRALAESLARPRNGDFIDIDGQSVRQGVLNTLKKNLTFANQQGLNEPGVRLLNSLEGRRPDDWLAPIEILPIMFYVDATTADGCNARNTRLRDLPARADAQTLLNTNFRAADLIAVKDDVVNYIKNSPDQYALGIEKNPWMMAYVAVEASVRSRQIFFPFGEGIELKARAFAKPFGGRMGPWYGQTWPFGSDKSIGDPVDPRLPPRVSPTDYMSSANDERRYPNYSRFPGDALGLRSRLAHNAMIGLNTIEPPIWRASYRHLQHLKLELSPGLPTDKLAWDYDTNQPSPLRYYELASVVPDLFDISYYSIEPNYWANYGGKIQANRQALGIPNEIVIRADLGHHDGDPDFNIMDQINVALNGDPAFAGPRLRQNAFYFTRDPAHVLTDWAPSQPYNMYEYNFPQNFGRCAVRNTEDQPVRVPGACLALGGRTGYSVKLVSRQYLNSNTHIGGNTGGGQSAILNPPSALGW